jgi:hypothetical protein
LERFAAAGTTVDKFCEGERLSTSSFYRWRERLQTAGAPAVALPQRRARDVMAQASAAGFIELDSLAVASSSGGGGLELRLDLGGGVVLQITRR